MSGKKALIIGMAKSGIGAAKLLSSEGWHVIVNDMKQEIPGLRETLKDYPLEWRLGEAPESLFEGVELIVPSPIIPLWTPFLMKARENGIEIISEIELGYRYASADFVCITGTNGKTTCTALTGELFKAGGFHTYVLGNIGIAITEHAKETKKGDVIVAETAALQLEGCSTFHAHAAGCCNVTEDHLDHFLTMENYIAAKAKVFENQTKDDFAVLNYDDPIVRSMASYTPAKVLYFSRKEEPDFGMFVRDGVMMFRDGCVCFPVIPVDEIRIPGGHNLENAMLSSLLAISMGISPHTVAHVLRTFPGVEHRIEFVREFEKVRYINDSKGTNPASTIKAVEAMKGPTILILGGYDKHSDFHEMFDVFKKSGLIKKMVVIGQTKQQILETAKDAGMDTLCSTAKTFLEAVEICRASAEEGDTVLLSPACASWGMFDNFEQRGEIFKQIVSQFH